MSCDGIGSGINPRPLPRAKLWRLQVLRNSLRNILIAQPQSFVKHVFRHLEFYCCSNHGSKGWRQVKMKAACATLPARRENVVPEALLYKAGTANRCANDCGHDSAQIIPLFMMFLRRFLVIFWKWFQPNSNEC